MVTDPPTDAASAPRFFVAPAAAACLSDPVGDPVGQQVALDTDQSKHARRVLRLAAGDAVQLLDGRGTVAQAVLAAGDGRAVVCTVMAVRRVAPPALRITLASAVPKGPRGDAMANDLAQLGTDVWVPMRTARGVVVPGEGKLARYRKAAVEAGKQSGRAWLMEVAALATFDQVVAGEVVTAGIAGDGGGVVRLHADPHGEPTPGVIERLVGAKSVVVLVGPEGGFTSVEAAAARDAGFVSWCFAPHILRVETAAAAAVAVLRALA